MSSVNAPAGHVPYDEFGYFADNAAEFGIAYDGPPLVERVFVDLGPSRRISTLVWGEAPPELVLIHGGAQNAHTWDSVALALDRPLVAVDLPGHGHSDASVHRAGHQRVESLADDVAVAIGALAPEAAAVVGMSLGGLTAIALARSRPELVRRLVLVDITPGVDRDKGKAITDFVRGPATFASFDELLARTIEHNPTRTEASLRRGILHNAEQLDDGSWRWRYRRHDDATAPDGFAPDDEIDSTALLWDALGAVGVPVMLARGMRPQSVVDDADEAELVRRLPHAHVVRFADAGHSVQGDMPVELAAAISEFVFGSEGDGHE
jgi:pimeloyl-ACP methyl ester carboxylesterase